MTRRSWLALLALAALFIGAGVFFAFQDLGSAESYASIASFLLALVVAGASTIARLRHGSESGGSEHPWHGARIARDNEFVNQGDHATNTYTKNVYTVEPPKRGRRS